MSYPALAQLLTASLDLQLVRLIRGAIAENAAGPGGNGITGRRSIEPEPRFEPRPVVHPEPRFEPRPVVEPAARLLPPQPEPLPPPHERVPEVPPAFGPLPTPWQTLLRQPAWERPVPSPITLKPPVGSVDKGASGRLLDQFA